MIVTTAGRTNELMIQKAKFVANELNIQYKERLNHSIITMQHIFQDDIFVVGKDKFSVYKIGFEEPLFFHPNSAMFRVKRLLKGEEDPFIHTAKLKQGMSILDCTLGLASDSIVASVAVGKEGKVVGIEMNQFLAYLVKAGLVMWDSGVSIMNEGMKRVEVIHSNHIDYLCSLDTNSFDVVYFDPMFDKTITSSNGIEKVRALGSYDILTVETITEAKRVAKQRIVMKDHWKSQRFDTFGFNVIKRPTAQFHYATIEVD